MLLQIKGKMTLISTSFLLPQPPLSVWNFEYHLTELENSTSWDHRLDYHHHHALHIKVWSYRNLSYIYPQSMAIVISWNLFGLVIQNFFGIILCLKNMTILMSFSNLNICLNNNFDEFLQVETLLLWTFNLNSSPVNL